MTDALHGAITATRGDGVTIHDIAQDSGTDFIVMEYIAGQTLGRLAARALAPKEVLKYAIQIADALIAAHAVGIIHRDLKPANVTVTGRMHTNTHG